MVDYMKKTKETERQTKAWRTGGLKFILALLIKEFTKKKVETELKSLPSESEYELHKLFD